MKTLATNRLRQWTLLTVLTAAVQFPLLASGQNKQTCTDAQKADPKLSAACSTPVPKASPGSPFPGDDADIPAGPGAKPDAPAALPQTPSAAKAAEDHPYPGEAPPSAPSPVKSAAGEHPYPGDPDAPKDGSSDGFSSSSSGSSSTPAGADTADDGPLKDAGSTGDDTKSPKGRRRKLPKIDAQTPEARESEDLDVAQFYMETGNTVGAYARAKDAVSISPSDPFAQFALAEAARKMGKPEEAREHYAKVLTLDPDDKQIRLTKKALTELGPAISAK